MRADLIARARVVAVLAALSHMMLRSGFSEFECRKPRECVSDLVAVRRLNRACPIEAHQDRTERVCRPFVWASTAQPLYCPNHTV